MAMNLDPQAVIPLPRLKTSAAATVGQSIESAYAGEKKHADNVAAARDFLKTANDLLKRALYAQLDPPTDAVHVEESRAEAGNFSGLFSVLDGVSNSSIPKLAAVATKLKAVLFTSGLTFLRMPTAERWMETEARITMIKEMKLEQDLHAIGAGAFLAAIHDSHKALGDAAGITSAVGVTAKSGVSMAYDKWKAAMRCYIAQVIANQALAVARAGSDAEVKVANDLAARLLAPIAAVDSSNAVKAEEPPPADKTSADTAAADNAASKPAAPAAAAQ